VMINNVKPCQNYDCPSQDSRYVKGCSERMRIPVNKCLSYHSDGFRVDWFNVVTTCLAVALGFLLGVMFI